MPGHGASTERWGQPGEQGRNGESGLTSYVGRVDWSFTDSLGGTTQVSSGLGRRVIVGPDQGAVHTELAVGALAPGGWLAPHVHSFEEALYVLEGELILELDRRVHRLVR